MNNKLQKIKASLKDVFVLIFSSKLILSLSSFYLFVLFYFVSNKINLFEIMEILNYLSYFFIGGFFSYVCLVALKNKKETDNQNIIKSIKPIEFLYISAYLGLIIISLSLPKFLENNQALYFLITIIFIIWLKMENVSFFNFYWLFFGYRFYEIETEKSIYILISKRKDVKDKTKVNKLRLKRINNYTFLEI